MAPLITPTWMKLLAGELVKVDFVGLMINIIKIVIVPIGAAFLHDLLRQSSPEPEPAAPEPTDSEPEDENIAAIFIEEAEPAAEVKPVQIVESVNVVESARPVVAAETAPVDTGPPAGDADDGVGLSPRSIPKAVRPSQSTGSPWDSFRILGVGLILALVLVAGYFLLNWFVRGNAEDRLARANSSYESRSYETAASMYAEFAEDFPSSEEVSFARVRAALATLRNSSEGAPDPEIGLDTALDVLPTISEEPSLPAQRAEVAGVLIALAGKFNDRADQATTIEDRKHLMSRMDELLGLTNDPRYVGANERNQQAPTIQRIEEDRQRILREINRDEDLAAALIAFDNKLAEKDTLAAYKVRRELIRRYPLLEADEDLRERVRRASSIQQTLVKPGTLRPSLVESPADSAEQRAYVLGNQTGSPAAELRGQVAFVQVKGSVYGLDAATGEILWRKHVGRDFKADPVRVGETSAVDALLCDPAQGHITRVAGRSGETQWFVDLGTKTRSTPGEEVSDRVLAQPDRFLRG